MLELRIKHSELHTFENRSKNIYNHNLRKQIKRIIKSSYTTYFSSFEILHRLIKSFIIPTPNKVFGSSKSHFLKSDLKNLKYLYSLKSLKSDRLQTIRKQWMRRKVKDTNFIILANSRNLKKVAENPV